MGQPFPYTIRKADASDIDTIHEIYRLIHLQEANGEVTIGWDPNTYPTRQTAESALEENTLFVMISEGHIVASAVINHKPLEAYELVSWKYDAPYHKIGVLHTLVVHPHYLKRGFGSAFVAFFENYCRDKGCVAVRLDTQVKNERPFRLYPKLGYRVAGIFDTRFRHLDFPIRLAMFEKKL